MNAKSVLILAVLGVIVSSLAWYLNQSSGSLDSTPIVFSELKGLVNQVDKIELKDAANNSTTLLLTDRTWQVGAPFEYYANTAKIRELILALSAATTIETKTSNPEYYSRLGVQDITQPSSKAINVKVHAGEQSFDLLVGSVEQRAGGASYVRKPQQAQTLLVKPKLEVSALAKDWLDTLFLDVRAEELQSIRIQIDDDVVKVAKSSRFGSQFELIDGSEDSQLNQSELNKLSRALDGLSLITVVKEPNLSIDTDKSKRLTFTLFDGIVIDVEVISGNTQLESTSVVQHWLVASARFDADIAQKFVPQPTTAEGNEDVPTVLSLTEADLLDRESRTRSINQRLEGWAYQISPARFANFDQDDQSLITTSE